MALQYFYENDARNSKIHILHRDRVGINSKYVIFLKKIYGDKLTHSRRNHKGIINLKRLRLPEQLLNDNIFGGNCTLHPKLVADKFRDLCLRKNNISTQIKNKVLLCPRKAGDPKRSLSGYESLISRIEKESDYEVEVWYNQDHTIQEQMQAHAESKVIISASGSDLANILWCNENNRVIEVIPNQHYSGLCGGYHNHNIESYLKEVYKKHKWIYSPIRGNNKRDWHFIKLPAENTIRINRKACEFYLSEQHENKIIILVKEVIV